MNISASQIGNDMCLMSVISNLIRNMIHAHTRIQDMALKMDIARTTVGEPQTDNIHSY